MLLTYRVDMAANQHLRPSSLVSYRLRVGEDIEAPFSACSDWNSLHVVAFLTEVLFQPFRALNLIV